jgi:site-specific DNA-methyltransferase (adenine-specific)
MEVNRIITGDFLQVCTQSPWLQSSIDLILNDPPYNLGVKYDKHNDRMEKLDYLKWTSRWIHQAVRCLKPTGSIYIVINDDWVAHVKLILDRLGLTMRNWIIWHYNFGPHQSNKFGRDHAHILYYVKNPKEFTFNADDIRVPSARQTTYHDRRANSKGRVPGDVWSFPRVCGTFKERRSAGDHPCVLPQKMLERIIKASSNPSDVVMDPMCGVASSLLAAKRLGRRWLGIELSEVYAEMARKRLESVCSQQRKFKIAGQSPFGES